MLRKVLIFLALFSLLISSAIPLYASDKPAKNQPEKKEEQKKAASETTDENQLLSLVGSCRLVGTSHFPLVKFSVEGEKESYSLSGKYEEEFKRLNGVKIRILAMPDGKKQMFENLKVVDYEILDVGIGEKPYFGMLEMRKDDLVLVVKDAGEPFSLVSKNKAVIQDLTEGVGYRAWVLGELRGGKLFVKKWRILKTD